MRRLSARGRACVDLRARAWLLSCNFGCGDVPSRALCRLYGRRRLLRVLQALALRSFLSRLGSMRFSLLMLLLRLVCIVGIPWALTGPGVGVVGLEGLPCLLLQLL